MPYNDFIKIGTLNNILNDVASFIDIDKKELSKKLFN